MPKTPSKAPRRRGGAEFCCLRHAPEHRCRATSLRIRDWSRTARRPAIGLPVPRRRAQHRRGMTPPQIAPRFASSTAPRERASRNIMRSTLRCPFRQRAVIGQDCCSRSIPRNYIPCGRPDKSGTVFQRIEQALQPGRNAFGRAITDFRRPAQTEKKQMLALCIGQHHRPCDAVQDIGRGRAATPLLQPRVPSGAHIRALRHFLPPKSRRASPLQRKAEGRGIKLGPAILQISPQRVFVCHHVRNYTSINSLLYPNTQTSNIPDI